MALINDILDVSKIEAGKMDIVPVDYSVTTLLSEVVNMIWIKAEEKKILGITIGRTAFFLLIFIGYGLLFNNFGIGLCFAFLFTTSFTMIKAKSKTKEEVIS